VNQANIPHAQIVKRIATKSQNFQLVFSMGRSRTLSTPSDTLDLSTPLSFGQVDHFRLCPKLFHEPECSRALGKTRHFAVRILEVPEEHGSSWTSFDTGGGIVTVLELAALGPGGISCALESVMAKGALLHNASRSDGDIGTQALLHRLGPLRSLPVELPNRVGTRGGAVTTSDAAGINLSHDSFFVD
jgi:hypothetical protein